MKRFCPELNALEGRDLMSAAALPIVHPAPAVAWHAPMQAACSSRPEAAVSRALNGILEQARAANDVPALAGGLIVDGKLAGFSATGVRERGTNVAVAANDQFHLGSNGKAMTATLAAILVERGAIRWNTTLAQEFPELKNTMNPAYRNVTLSQLLTHRSGIGDPDEGTFAEILSFTGTGAQARAYFLGRTLQTVPENPVGEFSYSNTGYSVAAAMMERATGRSYESLLQRLIFNPLGMKSAGFGPPGNATGSPIQPRGHDGAGAVADFGPETQGPAILDPAGLMHMNMADWSKFLRVHLGERVNGVKLLSDASLLKLHTPDPRPIDAQGTLYAYGWQTLDTPLGRALWHNGSNGYWYSQAVIIPGRHVAYFTVANQAGDQGVVASDQALAKIQERLGIWLASRRK